MDDDDNLQCRINFISSQIRENRISHHMLLKELKKELKELQEQRDSKCQH